MILFSSYHIENLVLNPLPYLLEGKNIYIYIYFFLSKGKKKLMQVQSLENPSEKLMHIFRN